MRSCASCHIPARAFTDGLPAPASLDPATPLLRNTPTLLYAPLHAAQLWDGRHLTAERQALGVIHAAAEMGLTGQELTQKLGADAKLRAARPTSAHSRRRPSATSLAPRPTFTTAASQPSSPWSICM